MGTINTMLTLDGESEFKRRINEINNNLKTLDKELTAIGEKFANSSNKMQKNGEVSANLSKQLEFLREKQTMLKGAVRESESQITESAEKLKKAKQEYERSGNAVEMYKTRLARAKQEESDFAEKVRRVEEDLKSARTQYGRNSVEAQTLSDTLNKAKDRLKQFQTNTAAARKELEQAEVRHRNNTKAVRDSQKELDRATKSYHQYRQQLADTDAEIYRAENEQTKLAVKTKDTTKAVKDSATTLKSFETNLKNVGQALITVGNGALTTFGSSLKNLESNLRNAGQTLSNVGNGALATFRTSFQLVGKELETGLNGLKKYTEAVTAAGVAIGTFATKSGMSFEAEMSKVQAYSGATAEDMEKLADAAKEMGATTSKTAAESAAALGYLSLNGYKTEQMLSTLKPIVKASEAGGMDLATAANQTARALTAYSKGAEDAEEFLNILAATQNNSATDMNSLLTTYVDLAGTFKQLHVGFEESATLLGQMANRGIAGSEAGTALNSIMLRLLETNKKSAEAFGVMGLSAWDAEGNFRGLTTVLKDLGEKMSTMTEQEKTLISKDLFGVMRYSEGMKFLESVGEGYDELYEINSKAFDNNYLYTTAATMMDNMKGKVTILKSATEALGISIFNTFSDKAVLNIEKFTGWINILNKGVRSGKVDEALKRTGTLMKGALIRNIELAAKELPSKLKTFNTAIIEGVKLLIQGMASSKNTILPELITGTKELVLGLIEQLPQFTEELTDGAVIMFTGIVDGLKETSLKLKEKIPTIITTLTTALSEHGPELLKGGLDILSNIVSGITEGDSLDKIAQAAVAILTALVDWFSENTQKVLEDAGKILGAIVDALTKEETLEKLSNAAYEILMSLSNWLVTNSDQIFQSYLPEVVNRIQQKFMTSENKDKMKEVGETLAGALILGMVNLLKGGLKIALQFEENKIMAKFDLSEEQQKAMNIALQPVNEAILSRSVGQTFSDFMTYDPNNYRLSKQFAEEDAAAAYYRDGVVVNVNNPQISNMGNLDDLIESTAQYIQAARAAGGK